MTGVQVTPEAGWKNWGMALVKVAVTVTLLGWLAWQLDFEMLASLLRQTTLLYVGVAYAMTLLLDLLGAWRWYLLLQPLQIRVPLWQLCHIALLSHLFKHTLPGGLGEGITKLYYVIQCAGQSGGPLMAMLMSQGVGGFALLSLPLAVLALQPVNGALAEAIGLTYAVILTGLLLRLAVGWYLSSRPLSHAVERLPARAQALLHRRRILPCEGKPAPWLNR